MDEVLVLKIDYAERIILLRLLEDVNEDVVYDLSPTDCIRLKNLVTKIRECKREL